MTKRAVWKFPLSMSFNVISVPRGAEFLHVHQQAGASVFDPAETPCLWARVDIDAPVEDVAIFLIGTGLSAPDGRYLGSLHMLDGRLVLHAFLYDAPVPPKQVTRSEHLDWCKQRAIAYLDIGDVPNAIASMISDLGKWDQQLSPQEILSVLTMQGTISRTDADCRRWIEGFR